MRALNVAITLVMAAVITCLPGHAQESQLDMVLQRDKLIVAVYSTAPPLSFVDASGELVGFEIDMARLLAKDILGDPNKVEFLRVDAAARFPSVLTGKADLGIASATVSVDRAVRLAFAYPYMDSAPTILVRKDAGITSLQELNDPKFTYAIPNVPPVIDMTNRVLPDVQQLLLETPSAMFQALKSNRAQAMTIDKPIAAYYATENSELQALPVSGTPLGVVTNNAIFVRPGDFEWWLVMDTFSRELRFGSHYEDYQALYRKWLNADAPPQRDYDTDLH